MAKSSLQNRLYWTRVYLGLCTRCGASLEENARYRLCDICRERANEHSQRYRAANKEKKDFKAVVEKSRAKPNSIAKIVHMAEEHGVSYGTMVAYLDGRIKELPK